MWVGKEEYDENGPSIVHRKCWPFGKDSFAAQKARIAFQNALPTRLATQVRTLSSDRDCFFGVIPRDICEVTARCGGVGGLCKSRRD